MGQGQGQGVIGSRMGGRVDQTPDTHRPPAGMGVTGGAGSGVTIAGRTSGGRS